MSFSNWLNQEVEKRGWSFNELARRAGMSGAAVSKTMSGKTSVTWDFCASIAVALDESPILVFRQAGLLPIESQDALALRQELIDITQGMKSEEMAFLCGFARFLRSWEESKNNNTIA